MAYRHVMKGWRSTLAVVVAIASIVAACRGTAGPTGAPSPSAAPSASPSATLPATPRSELMAFTADPEWRAVLQLLSGPGGLEESRFDAGARYRIRLDCIGDGRIVVRVSTRPRASRECSDRAPSEPVVVRGQSGGSHQARVTAQGEVEWIVQFEVPR